MKKIGIDARMLGPEQTGIGTYIKELINRIPQLDPDNEYVVFLLEPYAHDWKPEAPNVKKVNVSEKWYGYAEQISFPLKLMKERLDLVHFPHFNAPILYPGKSVVTIHDITPKFFHGHRMTSPIRRKGFDIVFDRGIKQAQRVIAVSQYTKEDIRNSLHIPGSKISVVYNGFETGFSTTKNHAKIKELKDRFGISKDFIFYMGVWRSHKNIAALVRAFDLIRSERELDLQLVLGGKVLDTYPEPQKAWEELGLRVGTDIILPGFIDERDKEALYHAASAYIVPSLYEGFGLNGLEAMACGTPVISSNTTALPEIYGDAAHYFDPGNTEDMADQIAYVLNNTALRNELITKGFEQLKKYSWDTSAQQTLAIYKQVLNA